MRYHAQTMRCHDNDNPVHLKKRLMYTRPFPPRGRGLGTRLRLSTKIGPLNLYGIAL